MYSSEYEDIYASRQGNLTETRHVFLAGNDLPGRWQANSCFTILETGFGAGVNFLAVWQLWKQSALAGSRLHFISVEKHPFRLDDLRRVHGFHPELAPLASQLHDQYPVLLPGFHRLHFPEGVILTLLFGEAVDMLRRLDARVDTFFLDGFAPARNPDMWSEPVFAELGRLAAPSATLATYTVAGSVREGLSNAGFELEKQRGFGRKREMLVGRFRPGARAAQPERRVIVLGAGLAGTACAERLADRGWSVEVIERHPTPAAEASGNPAGLIRPVLSLDWNAHSRFTTAGCLYTMRHLRRLALGGSAVAAGEGGVLQVARDAARFEKQQRLVEEFRLPGDFVRTLDAAESGDLVGSAVTGPGWWFPDACWAAPPSICASNLSAPGPGLRQRYGCEVASLDRVDGEWRLYDAHDSLVAQAPVLVLANAHWAKQLAQAAWLPLRAVRGQVSLLPAQPAERLRIAVCREGYVTPAVDGLHCLGASFNEGLMDPALRREDHEGNLQRLEKMLPGFGDGVDAGALRGRVAFRAMARDRLPVLGALGEPGLYACLGLGSRGMTWSALAAELVASQICGEPLPLERELVTALSPMRFASSPNA